jgi:hypothetical protein
MSMDETNALRISLGLEPLSKDAGADEKAEVTYHFLLPLLSEFSPLCCVSVASVCLSALLSSQ